MIKTAFSACLTSVIALLSGTLCSGDARADYATESEYTVNYSLAAIHAAASFTRGFTGAGVKVAILDSGVDIANPDLSAPGKILAGFDFTTNHAGVTADPLGHGTFVAGIIAGARNDWGAEGIAFGSTILPERIINAAGTVTANDATLAKAINYGFSNGARIFNNSWNSSTMITQVSQRQIQSSYRQSLVAWTSAVGRGALFVFAAGNDSHAQVGFLAGLPKLFPALKPGWLAAVATDQSGALASYSNRCGIAAAWCLAAPGSNIVSSYQGGMGLGSGTSFAAPAIAGAAADLLQEFPYLTAAQAGQILLKTANKTGIYANSAIYGQGLLDLDAATKPVGTVAIPSAAKVTGAKATLSLSSFLLSSAFGRSFARDVGPILVLDQFDRGYQVQGEALVRSAAGLDVVDLFGRFGTPELAPVAPGLEAAFADADPLDPAQAPRMRMRFTSRDGQSLDLSLGVDPALAYGNLGAGLLPTGALAIQDGIANPYLDLARDAMAVRFGATSPDGTHLAIGAFEGLSRAGDIGRRLGDPTFIPPHVVGALAELDQPVDALGAHLAVQAGAVVEQGSALGATSAGAFGSTADTPTAFAGIEGRVTLAPRLTLFGSYYLGRSSLAAQPGSLITHYGTVETDSFAIGLAADGLVRQGDRSALILSQPLRVSGGDAQLAIPYARDFDGNILTRTTAAGLAADGRERDLQAVYAAPLGTGLTLDTAFLARLQPDNQKAAPTDFLGLVKLSLGF